MPGHDSGTTRRSHFHPIVVPARGLGELLFNTFNLRSAASLGAVPIIGERGKSPRPQSGLAPIQRRLP